MSLMAKIAFAMLIQPIMLIIPGLILMAWPPRIINSVYGYRTRRSSQSQEAWDYANRRAGKLFVIVGTIELVVFAAVLGIAWNQPAEIRQAMYDVGLPLSSVLFMVLIVLIVVRVEIELKKKFHP